MLQRAPIKLVWPPPPEPDASVEAHEARLAIEHKAKLVNDSIDQRIALERDYLRRRCNAKILLLGQAESGKSTILKNFQLHFSPKAFEAEVEVWRPIIHLNLVRSVNFILNFLATPGPRDSISHQLLYSSLNAELHQLCIRLTPLREVEISLTKEISGQRYTPGNSAVATYNPAKAAEIRSNAGWKDFLKIRQRSELGSKKRRDTSDANRRILAACADDIMNLWTDKSIQKELKNGKISLQEQPGFFLDDVIRVTRDNYVPNSNDILRARVQTIGPEEHHINVESAIGESAREWIIYDVGGNRCQRAAWAQFFDDVNVIIFVASLSSFNQILAEDETENRLADSLKLWQMICSNRLLASVELILFLNKFDILDAKLKAGILFKDYVKNYPSQANDTKSVARYLLDMFIALHEQNSSKKRKVHAHMTCAINTKATASVIDRIHEVIMIKTLSDGNVM